MRYPSDGEIIKAYLGVGPEPTVRERQVTICRHIARDVTITVADLAVRSSDTLGPELARLHHAALRDAAIAAAVRHYLPALPPPGIRPIHNPVAERVVQSLIHRHNATLAADLVAITVALAPDALRTLDDEVERVARAPGRLAAPQPAVLEHDLRCALVEAVTAEWMHRRAVALDLRTGRNPLLAAGPLRTA